MQPIAPDRGSVAKRAGDPTLSERLESDRDPSMPIRALTVISKLLEVMPVKLHPPTSCAS
jgi:hypothetical protein